MNSFVLVRGEMGRAWGIAGGKVGKYNLKSELSAEYLSPETETKIRIIPGLNSTLLYEQEVNVF